METRRKFEVMEKVYKAAWRSFYKELFVMLLVLIAGCAVQTLSAGASWLSIMWICICVVEVLMFLCIMLKRGMSSLVLRDNPDDPANQEVAFITCNPFKPLSADFRKSVEIGLMHIIHTEVKQNAIQAMLNIGDVVITSAGTSGEEITARNIPDPLAVRDEIQVHVRNYTNPNV